MTSIEAPDAKRRKLMRACDACRRKKIKCDTTAEAGTPCSFCTKQGLECTFVEESTKRTPPKGYIEDLERRCELLEQALARAAPQLDIDAAVGPRFNRETWASVNERRSPRAAPSYRPFKAFKNVEGTAEHLSAPGPSSAVPASFSRRTTPQSSVADLGSSSLYSEPTRSEDLSTLLRELTTGVEETSVGPSNQSHSKLAGITLVHTAAKLKAEVEGESASGNSLRSLDKFIVRPWLWQQRQWENLTYTVPTPTTFKFPPLDLFLSLINLCFDKALSIYPILHRPSFERDFKAGLHMRDLNFAKIALLVCALGSRYSTDTRVVLDSPTESGLDEDIQWKSAGWSFFSQAMTINQPVLQPADLPALQVAALSGIYLEGSASPYTTAYLIAGSALRSAQDVGAHTEAFYTPDRPFENQMWKRVFWSLVALERINACGLRRSISISDDAITADLPEPVDDEHYNEVTGRWVQPDGKPSRLDAFAPFVRLTGLLAQATGLMDAHHLGHVTGHADSTQESLAVLERTLSRTFESIPRYLKFDVNIPDHIQFEQATSLQLMFYHAQMIIHQSGGDLASVNTCRQAARSIIQMLEVREARHAGILPPHYSVILYAGIFTLISLWVLKKAGLPVDSTGHIKDVETCIKALQMAEVRWHIAGNLRDILSTLAGLDATLREETGASSSAIGKKRARRISPQGEVPTTIPAPHFGVPYGIAGASHRSLLGAMPDVGLSEVPEFLTQYPSSVELMANIPMPIAQPQPQSPSNWLRYHITGLLQTGPVRGAMPGSEPVPHHIRQRPSVPGGSGARNVVDLGTEPGFNPTQDWSWMHDLGLFSAEQSRPGSAP